MSPKIPKSDFYSRKPILWILPWSWWRIYNHNDWNCQLILDQFIGQSLVSDGQFWLGKVGWVGWLVGWLVGFWSCKICGSMCSNVFVKEVFKEDVSKNCRVFGTHLSAAMRHATQRHIPKDFGWKGQRSRRNVCGDMCCNVMWPDVLIDISLAKRNDRLTWIRPSQGRGRETTFKSSSSLHRMLQALCEPVFFCKEDYIFTIIIVIIVIINGFHMFPPGTFVLRGISINPLGWKYGIQNPSRLTVFISKSPFQVMLGVVKDMTKNAWKFHEVPWVFRFVWCFLGWWLR